jgi:hypothetical protein
MESSLSGKRVLILQQRGWAISIGHSIAKHLHKEGCHLAAVTFKKSTDDFVRAQTDVPYELIISNDAAMSDPVQFMAGKSVTPLEQICSDLGLDSIWPIVSTLRNHVRSYGDKFYYAYRQNVSDEGIIAYVQATHAYITDIFQRFQPDVIISPNFVALPQIMMHLFAQKHGIKMMGVTDSKVKDIYIFTYSNQDDAGPFFDHLKDLRDGSTTSPNIDRAKTYINEFRASFKKPSYAIDPNAKPSLYKQLRHELSPYREIWNRYTKPKKNQLKSLGITPDNRPPRIILRDFYAQKSYKRFTDSFSYTDLGSIKKYVYFPLQFQPEASIDVVAPYFNNQLEMARLVAMSLPDDFALVVKEHPAMVGYRTPSFIKKLARTPNVKVVDYRISSEHVLKGANLIVSANSTSLVEAAFYIKPAIQFGNLGTTLQLPNVFHHTDLTTLTQKIRSVLATNLHTPEYEQRLEQYIAAAYDTGFSLNYFRAWEEGTNAEELWDIYKKEILSAVR